MDKNVQEQPKQSVPARKTFGAIKNQDPSDQKNKWIEGIAMQLEAPVTMVKNVPTAKVQVDKDNPRKLAVTPETISKIILNTPFDEAARRDVDGYIAKVTGYLEGKALKDFSSICSISMTLGSGDGLINPITVWVDGEGTCHLVAGERRYLAHILIGAPNIMARVLPEKPTSLNKISMQWVENNVREDLTLYEKLLNVENIISAWVRDKGASPTIAEIAYQTGMSSTNAGRYMQVIRMADETIKDAIKRGIITSIKQAEAMIARKGSKPKKTSDPLPPRKLLKIAPDSKDLKPIELLLRAAAEKYGEEVLADIGRFDLTQKAGLKRGLEVMLEFLSEQDE